MMSGRADLMLSQDPDAESNQETYVEELDNLKSRAAYADALVSTNPAPVYSMDDILSSSSHGPVLVNPSPTINSNNVCFF